jgi:hypothetical protein
LPLSNPFLFQLLSPSFLTTITTRPAIAMHSDNQQQKDFISSMFSQDSSNDSIPNTQDYYAAFPGPQAGMEGMMNMPSQNISMVNGQGTRQFLLEQQLKIQQLQQLQQLQQQIFQQQASSSRFL